MCAERKYNVMWQAAGGPERVQGTAAPQRSYYTLYLDDTHAGTIVSFPHTPHWMRACLATLQAPHTFIIMITRGVSSLLLSDVGNFHIGAVFLYVYIFSFIILPLRKVSGAARLVILIMPACCVLFIVQENWMQNCKLRRGDARGKYGEPSATLSECVCECTRGIIFFLFSDRWCVFKECRPRTHKSGFMAFHVSVALSKGHVVVGREKGERDTSDGFKIYRSYIVNVNPHKAPSLKAINSSMQERRERSAQSYER